MSKQGMELKVGLFVMSCLIVLAVLMLQFSKGTTFFRSTYTIYLHASNVGGLKPKASVLMSGVQIGTVANTQLSPEGTNVTIFLKIYKPYVVRESARFSIETSGFLGDQYVAVYPNRNEGAMLGTPGHMEADVEEPFNIQEAARSAVGFIHRLDETAKKLDTAVNDIRRVVLNEQTLTNLAFTINSLRQVSEDARTTMQNIDQLVVSNRVPASIAVSNLITFTERLNNLGISAQDLVTTNSPKVSVALENLDNSTAMLTNLMTEAQAGNGLVGSLIKDDKLANNVSLLASNLQVTSSNLNRFGLWRVIRGVKPPKQKPPPEEPDYHGRTPLP